MNSAAPWRSPATPSSSAPRTTEEQAAAKEKFWAAEAEGEKQVAAAKEKFWAAEAEGEKQVKALFAKAEAEGEPEAAAGAAADEAAP